MTEAGTLSHDHTVAPLPADKRGQILAAARAVFMEGGYANASMDAITRRAGVSKATVYAHFGSKAQLFGAMVREECELRLKPGAPAVFGEVTPEAGLAELGRRYTELVFSENSLALGRLVAAESARQPELSEAFYEAGPKLALETTARFFAEMAAKGALSVPDPLLAAELFLGAIRSDLYLRRFLGVRIEGEDATPQALERRVQDAARAFAAAYRGRG